jgi:hypothetical protein
MVLDTCKDIMSKIKTSNPKICLWIEKKLSSIGQERLSASGCVCCMDAVTVCIS